LEIIAFLKEPKTFPVFDDIIEADLKKVTSDWISQDLIEKGITVSKKKNKCILCKRDLDASVNVLFDKHIQYFNNEKSKFEKKAD